MFLMINMTIPSFTFLDLRTRTAVTDTGVM